MSVKVFDLCCEASHLFEGWFGSQEQFDGQLRDAGIACPICGSNSVQRLPSAPRLNLGAAPNESHSSNAVGPIFAGNLSAPELSRLQAMFVKAARHIAASTEDVGERFAEEARRMHYKETPERGIRGVASCPEAEALADEGVTVLPFPFSELIKETLQ
jgi:hypothetical protein